MSKTKEGRLTDQPAADPRGPVYDPHDVQHRRRLAAALIKKLKEKGFKRDPHDNPEVEQVWYRPLFKSVKGKRFPTRFSVKVCTSIVFQDGSVIVREKDADAIRIFLVYARRPEDRRGPQEITLVGFKVLRAGFLEGIPDRVIQRARSAHEAGRYTERCPWCKTAPLATSKKTNKRFCADACWTRRKQ